MTQKAKQKGNTTIKYHANSDSVHAKGEMNDGNPTGYWEWFRKDGTIKRSGNFKDGEPIGKWTTYDKNGAVVKVTVKNE